MDDCPTNCQLETRTLKLIAEKTCITLMSFLYIRFSVCIGVYFKFHNLYDIQDILYINNSSLERGGAAIYYQLPNSFDVNCIMPLIFSRVRVT